MARKNLHDLYQKLVQETADFCNTQDVFTEEDLIDVSSSLICFASDLLSDNTSFSKEKISHILNEALRLSLLSKEDIDSFLEKRKEEQQKNEQVAHSKKINKLLN